MPNRVPISFILDDPAPIVHVYQGHYDLTGKTTPVTGFGEPLTPTIPNSFLDRFCDMVEARGVKGKFSIVPSPCGKGDIVHGIEGFDPSVTQEWLDTARRRLSGQWDFCPEMITHGFAVNLETGGYFDENEHDWSQRQTRETLTPYITRALQLMKDAGFDCTGVTSPWGFGIDVEAEYVASIAAAQLAVYGRKNSWYFLHAFAGAEVRKPWVAFDDGVSKVVSIASTTADDVWWETINSPRTDAEFISELADRMLTADGKSGMIREVLDAGMWPILVSHWQSLYSNGRETGLKALDLTGRRVQELLADEVEWTTSSELMELTLQGA